MPPPAKQSARRTAPFLVQTKLWPNDTTDQDAPTYAEAKSMARREAERVVKDRRETKGWEVEPVPMHAQGGGQLIGFYLRIGNETLGVITITPNTSAAGEEFNRAATSAPA